MLGREDATRSGVTSSASRFVPNAVSLVRPALGAVALLFLSRNETCLLLPLVLVGCASDWLDGELARRTGTATPSGRIVDGLCDFVFLACLFAFLAEARAWSPAVWGRLVRQWGEANWLPAIALATSFGAYFVRMLREMSQGREPGRSACGHAAGVANYGLAIAGGVELLPGVYLGPWLLEPAIVGAALLNFASVAENLQLMRRPPE
jgi:phosphatidylglycerophosphate synthase